jgi:hypothetical protein
MNEELGKVKFSISDNSFMKYSVHIAVVAIVAAILLPVTVVIVVAVAVVTTFVWSVDINSLEWRDNVADEIFDKVRDRKDRMIADLTQEMENICEKTIEELSSTIGMLDQRKKKVCPLDQNQRRYITNILIDRLNNYALFKSRLYKTDSLFGEWLQNLACAPHLRSSRREKSLYRAMSAVIRIHVLYRYCRNRSVVKYLINTMSRLKISCVYISHSVDILVTFFLP